VKSSPRLLVGLSIFLASDARAANYRQFAQGGVEMGYGYAKLKHTPRRQTLACVLFIIGGLVLASVVRHAMKHTSPEAVYEIDIRSVSKFIRSNINEGVNGRAYHDVQIAIINQRYRVEFRADIFLNEDVTTMSLMVSTDELDLDRAIALYDSLEKMVINGPGRVMRPDGMEVYRHVVVDWNDNVRHSLSIAKYPIRVKYRSSVRIHRNSLDRPDVNPY